MTASPVDIPTFAIDPDAIRSAARPLPAIGLAGQDHTSAALRAWHGGEPFYQAPETPTLMAALDPTGPVVLRISERLSEASRVLIRYADAVEPLLAELASLRTAGAPATESDSSARAGRVAQIVAELQAAERDCASAIAALAAAAPSLASGAPGTNAAADASAAEHLADYLLAHPELDAAGVRALISADPAVIPVLGRKIADRLDALGRGSGQDLPAVTALLNTWSAKDPRVIAATFQTLGPGRSLQTFTRVAQEAQNDGRLPEFRDFATAFKSSLAVADTALTPDQQYAFGAGLVKEIESPTDLTTGYGEIPALSFLLYDSTHSTAFLGGAGHELDRLDRLNPGGPGMLRSGPDATPIAGLFPTDAALGQSYQDPITSLFTAFAHNGQAGLNFFAGNDQPTTVGAPFQVGGDAAARQHYYLEQRATPDRFVALFSSLEHATLDRAVLDDTASRRGAAGLVSSIGQYVPLRDLGTADVATPATVNLAHILSGYLDSVNKAVLTPKGGAERGSGANYLADSDSHQVLANITVPNIKSLVELAVSSDAGLAATRRGVSAFEAIELARGVQGGEGVLKDVLVGDARLEGFFTKAVGDAHIGAAADAAKARAVWVDLGKDVAGKIPLPGSEKVGKSTAEGIEFLYEHALDEGADGVKDQVGDVGDVVDTETGQADANLSGREEAIARQLYDPTGQNPALISDGDLRATAGGYSPDQVEKWFGDPQHPRIPTGDDVAAMSQDERDQFNDVLTTALERKSPTFADGTYRSQYREAFIEEFTKPDGS